MNFIEKIVVKCTTQQDSFGSDDLLFYLNNVFIGKCTISSGETKSFDAGAAISIFRDGIFIEEGDILKITEMDVIDSSDVMMDHIITQSDIDSRGFSESFTDDADYEFEIIII